MKRPAFQLSLVVIAFALIVGSVPACAAASASAIQSGPALLKYSVQVSLNITSIRIGGCPLAICG